MHQLLKNMLHAGVLKSKRFYRKFKALHSICLQRVLGKIFEFPDFFLFKFVLAAASAKANTPTSMRYITAQTNFLYKHYKHYTVLNIGCTLPYLVLKSTNKNYKLFNIQPSDFSCCADFLKYILSLTITFNRQNLCWVLLRDSQNYKKTKSPIFKGAPLCLP